MDFYCFSLNCTIPLNSKLIIFPSDLKHYYSFKPIISGESNIIHSKFTTGMHCFMKYGKYVCPGLIRG